MRLIPREQQWLLDSDQNRQIVDGLRALGIILVIAFHSAAFLVRELPDPAAVRFMDSIPAALNIVWQALGSEMVFLTSGFLLSYLLIREYRRTGAIDVVDYFVRRASRILPLFLIALLIHLPSRSFLFERVLANLFLVSKVTGHRSYIPVGWSLEVMVHVFILLPFIVLAVLKSRRPLLATSLLIAVSVAVRYVALAADPAAYAAPYWELSFGAEPPQLQKDLYYLTWFRLPPFLIGLAAAVLVTDHCPALQRWFARPGASTFTFLAGAVAMILSGWLPIHRADGFVYAWFSDQAWLWFWTMQRAVLAIGVTAVMLSAFFARGYVANALVWVLSRRVFQPISHGIYSIYLFHIAMLIPAGVIVLGTIRREEILEANFADFAAIVFLATCFSVWLARVLAAKVERPVQEWIRTRYQKKVVTLEPSVTAAPRPAPPLSAPHPRAARRTARSSEGAASRPRMQG